MKYFLSFSLLAMLFMCSCGTSKKISDNIYSDNEYADTTAYYGEGDESTDSDMDETSLPYRNANTIVNDLINTKLNVRFDWDKQYLYGKAWLTFKPHFYATDSLRLDAKGMDIVKLEMVSAAGNVPLNFIYDSLQLNIALDKSYTNKEGYMVYIEYVSKPNSIKAKGSEAITDAKGLYFINADGKDLSKPKQIWTQGETESNSCWFPTIDKPNIKTTLEISITADTGMVTLSNGLMISSIKNNDGTHTDTWKMDQPFAPYLAMMAVGKFSIIKDKWKNIEVNYYVDPEYAPYAKDIFGHTPEMLDFLSLIHISEPTRPY